MRPRRKEVANIYFSEANLALFKAMDRLAKRRKVSRSAVVVTALREYVDRQLLAESREATPLRSVNGPPLEVTP